MSRRLLTHHQDDVRAKIQSQRIIHELQRHVHGEREMSATQIQAARILLDKSVSNAPAQIDAMVDGRVEVTLMGGIAHGLESGEG